MLIVDAPQVTYCLITHRVKKTHIQQPGLDYQGKLYLQDATYPAQARESAIHQARQKLLEDPDQILLLVNEGDRFSLWHHVKRAQKVSSVFAVDLKQLVAAMRQPGGVEVKNRPFRLKTYPHCFVGSEAVDWLVAYLRVSRGDSVRVGQRLLTENWIHHVVDEQAFQDDYFFYRFRADD